MLSELFFCFFLHTCVTSQFAIISRPCNLSTCDLLDLLHDQTKVIDSRLANIPNQENDIDRLGQAMHALEEKFEKIQSQKTLTVAIPTSNTTEQSELLKRISELEEKAKKHETILEEERLERVKLAQLFQSSQYIKANFARMIMDYNKTNSNNKTQENETDNSFLHQENILKKWFEKLASWNESSISEKKYEQSLGELEKKYDSLANAVQNLEVGINDTFNNIKDALINISNALKVTQSVLRMLNRTIQDIQKNYEKKSNETDTTFRTTIDKLNTRLKEYETTSSSTLSRSSQMSNIASVVQLLTSTPNTIIKDIEDTKQPCPQNFSGDIENPQDETQFYKCNDGKLQKTESCPAKTYFNSTTKNCEWKT